MEKYFCDRCGKELKRFDVIEINYSDRDELIGRKRLYAHACMSCKQKFMNLLNEFIPNFTGN